MKRRSKSATADFAVKRSRGSVVPRGKLCKGADEVSRLAMPGLLHLELLVSGSNFIGRLPISRVRLAATEIQPRELIAFLVPKSRIARLTGQSFSSPSLGRVFENRLLAVRAHTRRAEGEASLRSASADACSGLVLSHFHRKFGSQIQPGSRRIARRYKRTVAIPFSRIKGFFPLTGVYCKRENSVPICKTGICVLSSRVRHARRVTGAGP